MTNLALWEKVQRTPENQTKKITGKAYSGTSPKPHYLVWKATETFGPCGIGWGFNIVSERVELGEDGKKIHVAHVKVWYKWEGEKGEVEHIGGTEFSGKRNNDKPFTDEDAPKKSVTDALIKALSMIGFAGDIFMGRYDDSKYVNELKQEEANAKRAANPSKQNQSKPSGKGEPAELTPELKKQKALEWAQGFIRSINEMPKLEMVDAEYKNNIERIDKLQTGYPDIYHTMLEKYEDRREALAMT